MNEEIAVYDTSLLPKIVLPLENEEEIFRGLGGRYLIDDVVIDVGIKCNNDIQMETLRTFYHDTIQHGQKPFYVDLPIFGTRGMVLVRWLGGFKASRPNASWDLKIKLKKEETNG